MQKPSFHVLLLQQEFGPLSRTFHLTLLSDSQHGLTLIDTGLPGAEMQILDFIQQLGHDTSDLKAIVLTHSDIDHAGSARALQDLTGAQVWAGLEEKPQLEGILPPLRTPPAHLLAQLPAELALQVGRGSAPVHVNRVLSEGEVLPGGWKVLFTPGHTPGHLSVFHPDTRVLVAGDAVMVKEGQAVFPDNSMDVAQATHSLSRLAGLDIQHLIAHHGGVLSGLSVLDAWRSPVVP